MDLERRKRINKIFATIYFILLIFIQASALYYIFTKNPPLIIMIIIVLLITVPLPIILGLILIKVFKRIYRES